MGLNTKKLLSYFWPQTKRVASNYSGMLELTWMNGRKILDSRNANYSYGSLQKILETGLRTIDLSQLESVLILGLGGGSLVRSLRETFNYSGEIVAIEIDAAVIDIARDEFGIHESEHLQIIHADAIDFVASCTSQSDLIIVDLFIDDQVPKQFYSKEFSNQLERVLSSSGTILFNLGLEKNGLANSMAVFNHFDSRAEFKCRLLKHVEKTNTLMIVERVNTRM